ncbi:MAG: membrane dipeptidase [Bacteroidales bacterium]|nr:membrane dipeptidase [Bacteroidales bacterium]
MIYTDLHVHPVLKCYGKNQYQPSDDPKNEANLFFHKRFNFWNRLIENLLTLTPYRQADLFSASLGNAQLLGNAMYSPERDFFIGKIDSPALENMVTDFGKDWIEKIQDPNTSYYDEMVRQFEFIATLNNQKFTIDKKEYRYLTIDSSDSLEKALSSVDAQTILLFYTVEGGHNLFSQVDSQAKTDQKIKEGSIAFLKSKKPFYFTLAHHFYNQLSGHCISLPPSLQKLRHQTFGTEDGNNELRPQGKEVINNLLSRENGQRIYIDVKHMHPVARNQYYAILDQMALQGDNVPLIFSHGGANGMKNYANKTITNNLLHNEDIGLYDDEIIRLMKSDGLFGLNMDERVMSSEEALKATKKYKCAKKRFKATSGLIWNNIEHIVKVCNSEQINPWPHICIGSDYDGIINPVNGFWTLEYLPRFYQYLWKHMDEFLKKNPALSFGMSQTDIMQGLFSKNMIRFMLKYYK